MKSINLTTMVVLLIALGGCSMLKKKEPIRGSARNAESTEVQSVDVNEDANKRAESLTTGWPQNAVTAAKEMVVKYGEPTEVTQDALIWKAALPFKRIIVHREVFSSRFPLLHQTSLEHVVDYQAKADKVDDIWNFDGSVVLNRTKGEMSASGESEPMNVLALNLAHEIMQGRMSPERARIQFGKETMNYLNGNKTAATQTLSFGNQINTTDPGQTITTKIRWVGDTIRPRTRQAQEAKK